MGILVSIGLVIVAAVLVLGQFRTYAVQYAWFCRAPILVGLLLFSLPFVCLAVVPAMLAGLLVLDPLGVTHVAFFATLAAWTVMFCLTLILEGAPVRCDLEFRRPEGPEEGPGWLTRAAGVAESLLLALHRGLLTRTRRGREIRAAVFFLFLALPLIAALVWSSIPEAPAWQVGLGAVMGVFLAWLYRIQFVEGQWDFVSNWAGKRMKADEGDRPRSRRFDVFKGIPFLDRNVELAENQANAVGFILLLAAVYMGLYFAQRPGSDVLEVPALGFILVLLIVACMGLSFLTYLLDPYRVPALVVLIAISFLGFWWKDRDHYFELEALPRGQAPQLLTPTSAYEAWSGRHAAEKPPLVVVAASGGGITAAYWTARVLAGLQDDTDGRFGESLLLVSSVSGGSVGAMYFVDEFEPDGLTAHPDSLATIVAAAGESGLAATAWGLVYPDLWRLVGYARASVDRGWALEQPWRGKLDAGETSMGDWHTGVAAGWRPAQAFNVTIVETGERLVISRVRLTKQGTAPIGVQDFFDLYEDTDLPVTTAARLSATFPFVTPVARPPEGVAADRREYHLADGGYYDNFGIVTALDFLNQVLEDRRAVGLDRVLLVRIQLADFQPSDALPRRGFLNATLGPLLTMMSVRTAAQVSRNDLEIAWFTEKWKERGVDIHTITFGMDDREAPLSWHLTRREKERISERWDQPCMRAKRGDVLTYFGVPRERVDSNDPNCRRSDLAAVAAAP